MKLLVLVFITVLFLGCGVNTDSSLGGSTTSNTDDNTSDPINGDDDDNNSGGVVVVDPSDSGFDKTDAEEDPNACIINDTFQAIDDSSFDPNAAADAQNGLTVTSQYLYSVDLEATKVALFYPELTNTKQDSNLHIYEDHYQFSFDKAWLTNANARVYIRTPKDIYGVYSCYRYELDSLSGDSITKTKVYR